MSMQKVNSYINKNQKRYLDELFELLKLPSISADEKYRTDVLKCADQVAEYLRQAGMEAVEVIPTGGYPAVYGEWLKAPGKPTVLIYGHYDVQPADPIDRWLTPPFEPTIKNGNICGRGTSDDKAQFFAHIKAVEAHVKNNHLPINVKFFIEGEEEGGSEHTGSFVKQYKEKLKCDAVLISDSPWIDKNHPSMCYSLRGLLYFELIATGPKKDLHSGSYGGTLMNPLNALACIIAKLRDEDGHVLVPGFYDDVVPLKPEEREEFAKLPFNEEEYKKELGVDELWGEKGYTTLERNWARPTLDVHGLLGGYTGAGSKTVITTHGMAKISSRLVTNQDPMKIKKAFESYIRKICPPGITLEFKWYSLVRPVMIPYDNAYVRAAGAAFQKTFGKKVVFVRDGASIPITITFGEELKAPSVLCGIGLPDDNLHSPNEKISLANFQNGIGCFARVYYEIAKTCKPTV